MEIIYVFIWLVLSFVVAAAGMERTIGFWTSFIASIILSPIVGAFIVAMSELKGSKELRERILKFLDSHEVGRNVLDSSNGEKENVPTPDPKLSIIDRIKYGIYR